MAEKKLEETATASSSGGTSSPGGIMVIFEDLGDLLLPNSSNSISWDELGLVDDFLILNYFDGDGIADENAWKEEVRGGKFRLALSKKVCESNHGSLDIQRQKWQYIPDSPSSGSNLGFDSNDEIRSLDDFEQNPVSPTLILDNNGGGGTAQENTLEEVIGGKFPVAGSKKVCKKRSHRNFSRRRQNWGNFHRESPNFPFGGDEIRWSDAFDGGAVSTTSFPNDNGGKGKVEEKTREDEAPDFPEKALTGRRQQLHSPIRCVHCQSEKTPQWRAGPMGPKTLCNACGMRYRSSGKLLPEYRPASSPTFDSSKHSNFSRR